MFENKEDIFELIKIFDKSSLSELDICFHSPENAGINIKMAKPENAKVRTGSNFGSEGENGGIFPAADPDKIITAPLVGVFYAAPSPELEPYVKIGDRIDPGSVICIIEAMKTMNEIESEISGEIIEILADDGSSVEYGQPLFRVR